jgi:hypothetical protein
VRLSAPQAAGHLVVAEAGATPAAAALGPGEQALYLTAHARPFLVPMFDAPVVADAVPKKKVDGEAILKRAMLRSRNPNAAASGASHGPRP